MTPHPPAGLFRPVPALILNHEARRHAMADAAARQAAYGAQRATWRADHPARATGATETGVTT